MTDVNKTAVAVRPVATQAAALPVERAVLPLSDEQVDDLWRRWSAWKGAAAANSIKSMEIGMRRFARYASTAEVPILPASTHAVVGYIRMLEGEGLKAATIANRLCAIALLHKLAGLATPTTDELVRLEAKRVRNKLGTAQKQSAALRAKGEIEAVGEEASDALPTGLCVATLCEAAGEVVMALATSDRAMDRRRRLVLLRDAAMLSLAYDGGLRSSELVAVRHDDVTGLADGRATLTIRRSKTDQQGEGAEVAVSRASGFLLSAWRHVARDEGHAGDLDRLFVRVTSSGFVLPTAPLRAVAVTDSFRRLVTTAILRMKGGEPLTQDEHASVRAFSGHAARIGAAQDALALREDLAGIMQSYRWQSPKMPMLYTRRLNALAGSAARTQAALR